MGKRKVERLPLTSDYVFKRIFGQEENKGALKDLLESILDVKINKIEINNPEIPKNYYDSKFGILDLKVTLDDKTVVDVEVQMQNRHNMDQRDNYYLASNYVNGIKEGEPYTSCKKSIVISILNFNYYKRNEYHSVARMIFEEPKEEERVDMGYKEEDKYASKYLELHIIELPKFRKKNPEVHTKLEQWLWIFEGSEEEMEKAGKMNKEIKKINKKLASMSLSDEERNNYEFRLKAIRDEADAIECAESKGRAEGEKLGVEKGEKLGRQEEKIKIVKEMLKNNFTIEQIKSITKLTEEEIEEIRKNMEK